jgi:hypothetical protein
MTIYRNRLNNRLYLMYKVTPPRYTGGWYECEDLLTGHTRKLRDSEVKQFVASYYQ